MTYWLYLKSDSGIEGGDRDHSYLCRFADQLDDVCQAIGVRPISAFLSMNEASLARGMGIRLPRSARPLRRSVDWFENEDGLATIDALLEFFMSNDAPLPAARPSPLAFLGDPQLPGVSEQEARAIWEHLSRPIPVTPEDIARVAEDLEAVRTVLASTTGRFRLALVG